MLLEVQMQPVNELRTVKYLTGKNKEGAKIDQIFIRLVVMAVLPVQQSVWSIASGRQLADGRPDMGNQKGTKTTSLTITYADSGARALVESNQGQQLRKKLTLKSLVQFLKRVGVLGLSSRLLSSFFVEYFWLQK